MKIFKLTAILFLLLSGVFGVSVFNHHLQLNADSKVTGHTICLPSTATPSAFLDKAVLAVDDNDLLVDDSLDDDDDGYFSIKEKTTSENYIYLDFASCKRAPYNFDNGLQHSACNGNCYQMPGRHFISLRVFRI